MDGAVEDDGIFPAEWYDAGPVATLAPFFARANIRYPDAGSGMSKSDNLFLVGPMGAGKSTIGRSLAEELGLRFVDSDQVIQERTGVDIPTIFEFEGEAGFRRREAQVIEELTGMQGVVLATGGGSVLDPLNRQALAQRGEVVYLHCTPELQYKRTMRDRNRPLLQTSDPMARLESLMTVRDPLYREVADLVQDTDRKHAQGVVRGIVLWYQRRKTGMGNLESSSD